MRFLLFAFLLITVDCIGQITVNCDPSKILIQDTDSTVTVIAPNSKFIFDKDAFVPRLYGSIKDGHSKYDCICIEKYDSVWHTYNGSFSKEDTPLPPLGKEWCWIFNHPIESWNEKHLFYKLQQLFGVSVVTTLNK